MLIYTGKLNLSEFALRTDHFLDGDTQIEHLHNRLLSGLLANVGREPPEGGVAPWVSANDKPTAGLSKSTAGNEAERRLKTEVMQLPARERRRLKDLSEPEVRNPIPETVLAFHQAKQLKPPSDIPPPSAGGLNRTNWELEIRKRYNQPLAAETGEFPDADTIQARMAPICYEEALPNGATAPCAGYLATALEFFIKEVVSNMFIKTRTNMSGGSVAGAMDHRFKQQFAMEEDAAQRGDIGRVGGPGGLLPIQARGAASRRPLGIGDLKLAIRTGESIMGNFAFINTAVEESKPEGEYEEYRDRRREVEQAIRLHEESEARRAKMFDSLDKDTIMNGTEEISLVNGDKQLNGDTNGFANGVLAHFEDDDDLGWQGGSRNSRNALSSAIDEVLNF